MSIDLREKKAQTSSPTAVEGRTAAPAKKPGLSTVVAEVLTDSQTKPGEYLDEVVVPKGGE